MALSRAESVFVFFFAGLDDLRRPIVSGDYLVGAGDTGGVTGA